MDKNFKRKLMILKAFLASSFEKNDVYNIQNSGNSGFWIKYSMYHVHGRFKI